MLTAPWVSSAVCTCSVTPPPWDARRSERVSGGGPGGPTYIVSEWVARICSPWSEPSAGGADHQDGPGAEVQQLVGGRAHEDAAQRPLPRRADDDHLGVTGVRRLDEAVGGRHGEHLGGDR